MSNKFNLIILDADVVIFLSKIGKLESLVKVCNVYLTRIIFNEIKFYIDDFTGERKTIDLNPYIKSGKIKIAKPINLNDYISSEIYGKMELISKRGIEVHGGEKEAIIFIYNNIEYKLCTGDGAAFKFLAYLGLSNNAVSLEEILGKIKNMPKEYTKKFMDSCLKEGSKLNIEDFSD